MTSIKIYVACLASYNAGRLHGTWIDLEGLDGEDTHKAIQDQVIKTSPQWDAEEWAIHDFESPVSLGEGEDLAALCKLSEAIDEHGEAFAVYVNVRHLETPKNISEVVDEFKDRYRGEWASFQEYVEDTLWGEIESQIPAGLFRHFDWESYARELEQEYCTEDGHVFSRG